MPRREKTAFIVFHGDMSGGPACGLVNGARRANALDLVERAAGTGAFGDIVLVTDSDVLAREAAGMVDRTVRTNHRGFHFGRVLGGIAGGLKCRRICYFGSGAGCLVPPVDIAALALGSGAREVVANNLYSTDYCAFTAVPAVERLKLPSTDNGLSRVLVEKGGFAGREVARRPATAFDIDAPLDLTVLKLHGLQRGRLREFVSAHAPAAPNLARAVRHFTRRTSEVMVAGRVSSDTHRYLDRETACRVRLVTEERGMASAGGKGGARSILGMWMAGEGPARAFASLEGRTHAAFIDTRLLLAHEGVAADAEDRFTADLLKVPRIRNEYLRSLADAALGAPFPVVLGSHSLLNGGLMLLAEAAWRRLPRDTIRGLRTGPDFIAAPPHREKRRDGTKVS